MERTADALSAFLREQDRHLIDIDMSGSLFLEYKKTFNEKNRNNVASN